MAAIFDNVQSIAFRNRADLIHTARLAGPVDWQDDFRPVSDSRFDIGGINIEVIQNVDKNRSRASCDNRSDRCIKREWRCDDFITLSNAERLETQKQGIRAAANANRVLDANDLRKVPLELIHRAS